MSEDLARLDTSGVEAPYFVSVDDIEQFNQIDSKLTFAESRQLSLDYDYDPATFECLAAFCRQNHEGIDALLALHEEYQDQETDLGKATADYGKLFDAINKTVPGDSAVIRRAHSAGGALLREKKGALSDTIAELEIYGSDLSAKMCEYFLPSGRQGFTLMGVRYVFDTATITMPKDKIVFDTLARTQECTRRAQSGMPLQDSGKYRMRKAQMSEWQTFLKELKSVTAFYQ